MKYLNSTFDLNDSQIISAIDELPLWSAPFGMKILNNLPFKKNQTVLDIGSGFGFPALEVIQRLGNGSYLYCVDPWEAAAERLKSKAGVYGVDNINIINQCAESIPLSDNSIDLIISNNGINNVFDEKLVIKECKRLLKPRGKLLMTFNLPDSMIVFYEVFGDVLRKNGLEDRVVKIREHIFRKRKPVEYYEMILDECGLRPVKIEKDSFSMIYIDGSAFLNHYFIRMAFMESWKEIVPESLRNEVFRGIEEELNRISEKIGYLKFDIPFAFIESISRQY